MSTILILYALTASQRISFLLTDLGIGIVVFVLFRYILSGILYGSGIETPEQDRRFIDRAHKFAKKAIPTAIVLWTLATLIPSRNDFVFILGGNAVINAIYSNKAQVLGDKTMTIMEQWLDQHITNPKDNSSK